jgi:protein-disulfide isomerase
MSQHHTCAPGVWEAMLNNYGKFKGRILPQDDQEVLTKLEMLVNKYNDKQVKIYDVSRMSDKMKAIRLGINKTPTVIIEGQKYEGLEKILHLLE